MYKYLSIAFLVLASLPLQAHALQLNFPVRCALGKDCFIQNYVDHDSGAYAQDHGCGSLTYDGHKGTDIRLRNRQAMENGVKVIAAANGIVRGLRDGQGDQGIANEQEAKAVKNIECGNGVLLVHEGGYETQYCHLKKGSITVATGDTVKTGQVLGEIGLSGLTEFPHVHFELRKGGMVIDPFTGTSMNKNCKTGSKDSLWSEKAQAQLRYIHTALLQAGFAADIPTQAQIERGEHQGSQLPADAPLIAFWGEAIGIQPGDQLSMRLIGPDRKILAKHAVPYDRAKARIFNFIGAKRKGKTWPRGTYVGEYRITRKKNGDVSTPIAVKKKIVLR